MVPGETERCELEMNKKDKRPKVMPTSGEHVLPSIGQPTTVTVYMEPNARGKYDVFDKRPEPVGFEKETIEEERKYAEFLRERERKLKSRKEQEEELRVKFVVPLRRIAREGIKSPEDWEAAVKLLNEIDDLKGWERGFVRMYSPLETVKQKLIEFYVLRMVLGLTEEKRPSLLRRLLGGAQTP